MTVLSGSITPQMSGSIRVPIDMRSLSPIILMPHLPLVITFIILSQVLKLAFFMVTLLVREGKKPIRKTRTFVSEVGST